MRRLIGVLGADDDATDDGGSGSGDREAALLHPQPRISDLHALLATVRAAGLPVTMQSRGEPPAHDGVQTVVFRVVQESLTNALRYAPDASLVRVKLVYEGGGADVTVTDDGRGGTEPQPSVGSGRGLIGMRERAALYGGTVDAAPMSDTSSTIHACPGSASEN